MAEIETFKFVKEVPCVDADGVTIREGSVLVNVKDGERGIVTLIGRKGTRTGIPMFTIGDLAIHRSAGITRVTNKYSEWRHIPHNDQTYTERLSAWKWEKYDHEEDRGISKDEGLAIDGIMALLPDNTVNWDRGPWPDRLEDALMFLAEHMTELKPEKEKSK